MGRPSIFTQELAQEICDRLAEGETLKHICEDDDKPAVGTICRWIGEKPAFRELYERARESQCEFFLEEILEIGDEEPEFHHHVGWARNRIDARKWAMSKLAVRRYGDKTILAGADGASPAKIEVSWRQPESSLTIGPADNSSPSMSAANASPALSLTVAPEKQSVASTTSNAQPLDVDWRDPDTPISPPIADKPKP